MSPNCVLRAKHQALADLMIRGIARQEAQEVPLRSEDALGEAEVERVVDALVRIERIVAPVLHALNCTIPTRTGCESVGTSKGVILRSLTLTRRYV